MDFRASALSKPTAVCVPFLHLAFSLCASLSKLGEKHSFRGGITMENSGFLHIMTMEDIKELQKAMRDIFVGGFIFYQTFLAFPSGRQN